MLSFCRTVHHIIFLVIFTWWAFLEFVQALGSSLPTLTSVSLALLTSWLLPHLPEMAVFL